jgi:alkanesulfonate monooxygenase
VVEFIWQLPSSGDGRFGNAKFTKRGERDSEDHIYSPHVTDPRGTGFNYFDYLHQVARAADLTGFDGIQIQHDLTGDESWIIAGYLVRGTRHVKLVTEFEASRGSAVYAAKNAVSFQRFSGNRFAWQISAGGDEQSRKKLSDNIADIDKNQRIVEFVRVAKGVMTQAPFNFKGDFFEVLEGGFKGPLAGNKVPDIYLSGETDEAIAVSAAHANYHIINPASAEDVLPLIQKIKGKSKDLAIGLRIDVLARETQEEAVFDAERFLSQTNKIPQVVADRQHPYIYQQLATEHTHANLTLVGSYADIINQLKAFIDSGVSSFILAAIPHLEEAYRVGEHVLPHLRTTPTASSHIA